MGRRSVQASGPSVSKDAEEGPEDEGALQITGIQLATQDLTKVYVTYTSADSGKSYCFADQSTNLISLGINDMAFHARVLCCAPSLFSSRTGYLFDNTILWADHRYTTSNIHFQNHI